MADTKDVTDTILFNTESAKKEVLRIEAIKAVADDEKDKYIIESYKETKNFLRLLRWMGNIDNTDKNTIRLSPEYSTFMTLIDTLDQRQKLKMTVGKKPQSEWTKEEKETYAEFYVWMKNTVGSLIDELKEEDGVCVVEENTNEYCKTPEGDGNYKRINTMRIKPWNKHIL